MNKTLFLAINSLAGQNHFLDLFFIGCAEFMPYIFILAEVYLYFIAKRKNEAIFAFYAALIGLFINQIIGLLYFHNRPFMDHIGLKLIHHLPDNSFPSDHTTFLFAIAVSLLFYKKTKNWGKVLLILAFFGGLARVYVGVHYPFDIIGAILTGIIGAFIVFALKDKLWKINDIIIKIEYKILKTKR
jgi:undecaprenyl-diphosphatase